MIDRCRQRRTARRAHDDVDRERAWAHGVHHELVRGRGDRADELTSLLLTEVRGEVEVADGHVALREAGAGDGDDALRTVHSGKMEVTSGVASVL